MFYNITSLFTLLLQRVNWYFIFNVGHEVCLSMDIVLCHLLLLHQLTIHVHWHHKPHLTSLSNGSWFITHPSESSLLTVSSSPKVLETLLSLGFILDGHIMSLIIAYSFFWYCKAFLNKFNYTLVIIQHGSTSPVKREN